MSYTGNEEHDISLNDASEMTARYRNNKSADQPNIGEYFGGDAIKAILAQAGCVGIRIYFALDENMSQKVVLVGADANGNDLHQGILAERGLTDPPYSSSANSLNT